MTNQYTAPNPDDAGNLDRAVGDCFIPTSQIVGTRFRLKAPFGRPKDTIRKGRLAVVEE